MPISLRAAQVLIWIRLMVMTMVMLLTVWFITSGAPEEGFFKGIQRALFNRFDIESGEGSAYNLGLLTGTLTLPLAAMVAQLILIRARKRYTMLLLISLMEIVLAITRFSFPFVGLVIFVLLLFPSSREVFQEETIKQQRAEILDDIFNEN